LFKERSAERSAARKGNILYNIYYASLSVYPMKTQINIKMAMTYLLRQILLPIMVCAFHFDIDLDIPWRN
jgi:hypothetical protein